MSLGIITDPRVAQWVIDRCPDDDLTTVQEIGPYMAFGVHDEHGTPLAGIVYNWYRPMKFGADFRVIIAADSPRWCRPGILRELFAYPFETCGCSRLTAVIRDGNEKSIRLCKGLGFRQEGVLRRGYNGRTNALLFGLLKNECKWLKRPPQPGSGNDIQLIVRSIGERPAASLH